MEPLTISVIGLGGLAGGLAAALGVADRYLRVETDPREDEILDVLPGANCGGCGQPGCRAYAEAVVKGETTPDKCNPGGTEVAQAIAEIMGVEVCEITEKVAVVHCHARGGNRKMRAEYHGPLSCEVANLLGGHTECGWGCLGLDDCAEACTFGAMEMVDGLPVVDPDLCTACSQCVAACPRNIISLQPIDPVYGVVYVACNSEDKGPLAKKLCDVGCVGCGLCNRKSPNELFTLQDFLAHADPAKIAEHQDEAQDMIEQCPRSCILRIHAKAEPERVQAEEATEAIHA